MNHSVTAIINMREFEFINQYLKNKYFTDDTLCLGIGDDAATLKVNQQTFWHISTDMLLANRHFFADERPEFIAYKALAVNFSDMAAMGAKPKWVLLSLALPNLDITWLDSFFKVFDEVLQNYEVKLIGGDTTKGEVLTINITIIGETNGRGLQRNQAQLGDDIWVTGRLGLAAAALHHHWGKVNLPENEYKICEQARVHPIIRVGFMSQARTLVHAAQDISDGLLQDLGHILTASNLGAEIELEKVPSMSFLQKYTYYDDWVLNGGDDYEVVFTASRKNQHQLEAIAAKNFIRLYHIGKITQNDGCIVMKKNKIANSVSKGFDHFED